MSYLLFICAFVVTAAGCAPLIAPPELPLTPTPDAQFRESPPSTQTAPIIQVPDITEARLSNGMTVLLASRNDLPMATVAYINKAARDDGSPGEQGLAALTSAIVSGRDADVSGRAEAGEDRGQAFRLLGQSFSSSQTNTGSMLYATVLASDVGRSISQLAQRVLKPNLSPEAVAVSTRFQLARSTRLHDKRWFRRNLLEQLYAHGHPLTLGVLGDPEIVHAMTADKVKSFYEDRYGPEHSAVVVVGAIDIAATIRAIERAFAGWSHSAKVPPERTPPTTYMSPRAARAFARGQPRAAFRVEVPCVGLFSSDTIPGELIAALLRGQSSQPARTLRHEMGANYSLNSGCLQSRQHGQLWIEGDTEPNRLSHTLGALLERLNRLTNVPPTEKELEQAKARFLGGVATKLSNNLGLAKALREVYFYGLSVDHLAHLEASVRAVTGKKIVQVAQKTIGTGKWAIGVIGPKDQLEPQLEWLGSIVWR